MARCNTTIKFVGGSLDGRVDKNVSLRYVRDVMHYDTGIFFAETDCGGAEIIKGTLTDRWDSFGREIYEKAEQPKNSVGVTFVYSKTIAVERCEAITKSGRRCMKPAREGELYCSKTHEPKN